VKKFAMIDIQRYQNVAVGDTVHDTQKSYEALLATNGALSKQDLSETSTYGETSGVIRTIATAVIEGNSHYYVTLEGDNSIYDFVLPGSLPIVAYREGDEIAFTYVEGDPANTVSDIVSSGDKKAQIDAASESDSAQSQSASASASASATASGSASGSQAASSSSASSSSSSTSS